MKIWVAVQIEAEKVALFDGEWFCGNTCPFNDSGVYCTLFEKYMIKRLSECILATLPGYDEEE